MYFGSPVIAAREKGAVDVVKDGVSGLTIDFGDVCALASALDRVLVDTDLRARLTAGGHALVTDNGPFTFTSFAARAADLLGLQADSVHPQ
jgi:glycosyltransferase involved in cell wall biosynthesis